MHLKGCKIVSTSLLNVSMHNTQTMNRGLYSNGLILLLLTIASVPAIIWLQSIDDIKLYFEYDVPPGQTFYILSKLAGLYAVFMLCIQVILGLINRTPLAVKIGFLNIQFHRNFGLATFTVLLLHIAFFMTAVSIRQDHIAYKLLLPNLDNGFYNIAVSLGVFAFYGLLIVIAAGFVRKRVGSSKKTWQWMHRVSFIVLMLTLLHCILIGTETRYFMVMMTFAVLICTFLIGLYYRYIYTPRKVTVQAGYRN